MNKQELIKQLSEETGLHTKHVREVMDAFLRTTTEVLQKGDYLCLQNFGTLQPVRKKERPGRNPKTNEQIPVSARTVIKFKVGKRLHELLNG